MSRVRESGVFLGLGLAAFGTHLVYPAALTLATRLKGTRPGWAATPDTGGTDLTDGVVVLIPAFRERSVIKDAVAQVEAEGIPSERVVVLVDGDEETASIARNAGATVDFQEKRAGKGQAINRGMAAHPDARVVVLMDANVQFEPGTIRNLLIHMADHDQDVTSATKHEAGNEGEGLYWKFERHLIGSENALGGSLAVVGELLAVRRSAFVPIPDLGVNDDQFIALSVALNGGKVGVATEVGVHETSAPADEQFERRVRMAAFQFRLLRHLGFRRLATPKAPIVMFLAHKGWRTSLGPLAQLAMVLYALRHPRSPLAPLALAGNALGVAAYGLPVRNGTEPRGGLAALFAQAVGMPLIISGAAFARVLKNPHGTSTWTKRDR